MAGLVSVYGLALAMLPATLWAKEHPQMARSQKIQPKGPDWPSEQTLRVLRQQLEQLQAFKGKNYRGEKLSMKKRFGSSLPMQL
jgi:hypothetical protein